MATPSSGIPYHIENTHFIDGVRYFPATQKEHLEQLRELEVHEDDVYLCGYWKSGNNWVRRIVKAILSHQDLEKFATSKFDENGHLDLKFDDAKNVPHPGLFWSLLPYDYLPAQIGEKKAKIIYLVRNPKDVAVSYYYFHKYNRVFGPWEGEWDVFIKEFLSGSILSGNWFEHSRSYWVHHNDKNILFVRYEDLNRDSTRWIRQISDFLGIKLEDEKINRIAEIVEFNNMKKNPNLMPYTLAPMVEGHDFLRKGVVGDWRELFTEEQSREVDEKLAFLRKETGYSMYVTDD